MARNLLISLALLGALGCEGDPRPLGWELEFDDPALLSRAVVVDARILEGGCDGEPIYSVEVARAATGGAVDTPVLDDGTYGFAGRAHDPSCTLFAEGCTEVTLPIPGPVVVVLTARAAEVPACRASACSAGSCAGARDGGGIDGGARDGGGGCAASETRCGDGVDDDCDGRTDCNDENCDGDAACAGCDAAMCGDCEICQAGSCVAAPEGELCGVGGSCRGGGCCTGCWDGSTCQDGSGESACGAGGVDCAYCSECGACNMGGCIPMNEGMACMGGSGQCLGGTCCTGCGLSGGCVDGTAQSACGSGGASCTDCGECGSCSGGACAPADGIPCTDGICRGGACCDGCWDGAACQPGDTATACGVGGASCGACLPCQECMDGMCVAGTEGSMCTSSGGLPGRCRGAPVQCCAGCWDGASCQPGDDEIACGSGGIDCFGCPPGSECTGRLCRPI